MPFPPAGFSPVTIRVEAEGLIETVSLVISLSRLTPSFAASGARSRWMGLLEDCARAAEDVDGDIGGAEGRHHRVFGAGGREIDGDIGESAACLRNAIGAQSKGDTQNARGDEAGDGVVTDYESTSEKPVGMSLRVRADRNRDRGQVAGAFRGVAQTEEGSTRGTRVWRRIQTYRGECADGQCAHGYRTVELVPDGDLVTHVALSRACCANTVKAL